MKINKYFGAAYLFMGSIVLAVCLAGCGLSEKLGMAQPNNTPITVYTYNGPAAGVADAIVGDGPGGDAVSELGAMSPEDGISGKSTGSRVQTVINWIDNGAGSTGTQSANATQDITADVAIDLVLQLTQTTKVLSDLTDALKAQLADMQSKPAAAQPAKTEESTGVQGGQ